MPGVVGKQELDEEAVIDGDGWVEVRMHVLESLEECVGHELLLAQRGSLLILHAFRVDATVQQLKRKRCHGFGFYTATAPLLGLRDILAGFIHGSCKAFRICQQILVSLQRCPKIP